jgi:hypothetical protein
MTSTRDDLFSALEPFVRSHGIDILEKNMDVDKPGEFDGPTITVNPKHDGDALGFYLVHSFGSIYQWSTGFEHAQRVFDDLRDAKRSKGAGFDKALEAWRLFEQASSDHAVWVLGQIGRADAIDLYSVFFRADIEAMTVFHRTGKEPQWPDFFAEWKEKVARGEIRIEPFRPKPVARFRPVRIEKQEVLQERD